MSKPAPAFCEQAQDRKIAICFYRVADCVGLSAEGYVVGAVGFENRLRGVDVARGAGLGGYVG